MDVKFNINDEVLVKLTERGIDHWIQEYNIKGLPPQYFLTKEKILAKKLDNGYWAFKLWELIQLFGNGIVFGMNEIVFETNIIIPVDLSRQNKIDKIIFENNGN